MDFHHKELVVVVEIQMAVKAEVEHLTQEQ
jgi:hypothetical protein